MTPARCGWCISGDHNRCVVVVKMGVRADRSANIKKGLAYFWRCPCSCLKSTKCLDCQRLGVDVDESWQCLDRAECERFRTRNRGPFTPPRPKEDSHV